MAKKKNEDSFYADLAEATGGQVLAQVGQVPYFVDSGNLALNYICSGRFIGGGFPGGRIIEAYGPESSAKSLLGYCFLGNCQRMGGVAVHMDCERAANAQFAQSAGHVDPEKMVTYEPPSIQAVERKVIGVVKAIRKHKGLETPIGILWDSITVSPSEREWSETELPENPTEAQIKKVGQDRPGERAKAAGDTLRLLNPFLNDNSGTMFIINQIRSKIGVLYGDPNTTGGGGMALKFYASCRLATGKRTEIIDGRKTPIGVNLSVKNKKSRCFTPGLETTGIQLYYEYGINPLGGLLSILIGAGRVELVSKGNYKVTEKFSNGSEIKFKSSKDRNDVPLSAVLECPPLIDAESKEQVEKYMEIHMPVLEIASGKDIVEIPANIEEALDIVNELVLDDDD